MTKRTAITLSFLLTTLLIGGAVELFYNVWSGMLREKSAVVRMTTQKKADTAQQFAPSSQSTTKGYGVISSRNLFGKPGGNRELLVTTTPILKTTSLDLVLLGTVTGNPDDQWAIIQDKKSARQKIYQTGDRINNSLIKKIDRDKITLTINGKNEILLMAKMKTPPSTGKSRTFPIPGIQAKPKSDHTVEDSDEIRENIRRQTPKIPVTTPRRRLRIKPPTKQQVAEP